MSGIDPAARPGKTTTVSVTTASGTHTFNADAYLIELRADRDGVHVKLGTAAVAIASYTEQDSIPLDAGVVRQFLLTKPNVMSNTDRHVALAHIAPAASKLTITEYFSADAVDDYGSAP